MRTNVGLVGYRHQFRILQQSSDVSGSDSKDEPSQRGQRRISAPTSDGENSDNPDNAEPDKIVRIAYFDHAGTASIGQEPIGVTASILIHGDIEWRAIERFRDRIIAAAQWGLTEEQQIAFEFHAKNLFWSGHPPFAHWLKEKRHALLREFLKLIPLFNLPICLGATDRAGFRASGVARSFQQPIHLAEQQETFFECALAVNSWLAYEVREEVAICIFDLTDKPVVKALKRQLRRLRHYSSRMRGLVWFEHLVEAAHFADPTESFGLELADACSFFLKRHLMDTNDQDADSEALYAIIEPQIVYPAEGVKYAANPWARLKQDHWPKANKYERPIPVKSSRDRT